MQEIATASEGAASLHGHIAGGLLHPPLVRMTRDPGDVHPAGLEMNEKQHVVTSPRSVSTSAVKKSVPASSARWIRMKAGHVVVRLRSGAGGSAWRGRILPTV